MGLLNLVLGTKTTEEERQRRLAICQDCEFLMRRNSSTAQCRKCGCFVNLKDGIAEEKCPIGKW